MKLGARALALAAVFGGALAACVFAIDPLPEAPGSSGDGGASDAGDAGSSPDAPSPDGGALDGARAGDADAAAGPYCQTVTPKPAFCDDFDQDQSSIWKAKYVDDGGTLGLDPTAFVSPPSSLRSTMLTSATCQYASYSRDFTLTFASRFRLAFDLAVGHLAGDAGFVDGVAINEISLAGPGDNGRCGYYFSVSPGAASLAIETSGTGRIELSPFIPTAKWTHVELVVDKATSTAQVSIDGVDAGAGAIPSACQLGEVGTLDVGILCAQPGVDFDVHEDNLAMWTE